jgi:hypothetical protein
MNLIYGELDIDVPKISLHEFDVFFENTQNDHRNLKHSIEEDIYFERNKKKYPWQRRILEVKGSLFHEYRSFSVFSSILQIIDYLPIKKETRVVTILYQKEQFDYDFNFHFDNDKTYGFRVCFGLEEQKVFLELARIKDEYQQHALNLKKIENYMVDSDIIEIIPKKSNTVLCLNGFRYPHRVPITSNCVRVAIIVRGEVSNMEKLNFIQKVEE